LRARELKPHSSHTALISQLKQSVSVFGQVEHRSGRRHNVAVHKTGACAPPVRPLDLRAVLMLDVPPSSYVDTGSCEQSHERQSVAGIAVGEKNRCIVVSALDARSSDFSAGF
jgi:hypothetical protein